jgi:hypothetical protein
MSEAKYCRAKYMHKKSKIKAQSLVKASIMVQYNGNSASYYQASFENYYIQEV